MTDGNHKNLSNDNLHLTYRRSYADATARLADTYSTDDEGHLFRQESDNTLWMLVSHTGPTFAGISSTSQNSIVDVASGATANIGAASSVNIRITGTTTITAFDNVSSGIWRQGYFAGVLTLTHNATSLILPGGANITTAAGDSFKAISLGSGNWKVLDYVKADGTPIAGGGGGNLVRLGAFIISGRTATYSSIPNTGRHLMIKGIGASTVSLGHEDAYIYLNNDTTNSNYNASLTFVYGNSGGGTTGSSGLNAPQVFSVPGATAGSNRAMSITCEINNYKETDFYKQVLSATYGIRESPVIPLMLPSVVQWNNVAAINRIDLVLPSGNWATGSQFDLYQYL